jgi:hypothetical protein
VCRVPYTATMSLEVHERFVLKREWSPDDYANG